MSAATDTATVARKRKARPAGNVQAPPLKTLRLTPTSCMLPRHFACWSGTKQHLIKDIIGIINKFQPQTQTVDFKQSRVGLSLDPAGDTLVTGSSLGNIHLWDVKQNTTAILKGHTAPSRRLEISPHHHFLVSGSTDCTARLWDIDRRKQLAILQHKTGVTCVKYSPQCAQTVATGCTDHTVYTWDVPTGQPVRAFSGQRSPITTISMAHRQAQCLASGSQTSDVLIWDMRSPDTATRTIKCHPTFSWAVTSVCFNPIDDNILAVASTFGSVVLWDLRTNGIFHSWPDMNNAFVYQLEFNPEGSVLFQTGSRNTSAIKMGSWNTLWDWSGNSTSSAMSVDGHILARLRDNHLVDLRTLPHQWE